MAYKSAATSAKAPAVVYLPPAPPKNPPHPMLYDQWFQWLLVKDWRAFVCVEKSK